MEQNKLLLRSSELLNICVRALNKLKSVTRKHKEDIKMHLLFVVYSNNYNEHLAVNPAGLPRAPSGVLRG